MQHVKSKFRPVFTALRAEIKGVGGLEHLAAHLGKSYGTVANRFNPDNQDAEPTLEDFLEAVEFANANRTVNVLATLVGHVAIPVGNYDQPTSINEGFTQFLNDAAQTIALAVRGVQARHLGQQERAEHLEAITQLVQSAVALQGALRG